MDDIDKMIDAVGTGICGKWVSRENVHELVRRIQRQHALDNRDLSHELLGVIIDVEEGSGFDQVCLNTIKRVCSELTK